MLKIEYMDFLSLNVQSVQTFKQLCEWLGTLLDSASTEKDGTMMIKANPNQELFSNNYFEQLSKFLTLHNYKGVFEGQSIILQPPPNSFLSEDLQQEIQISINETMRTLLREGTLFFEGKKSNSEFFVVIADISPERAKEISLGLMKSLIDQLSDKINFSEFSVSIKSVGEKSEPGPVIK